MLSSFAVIQRHPGHAAHVRHIDVRAVPTYNGAVHSIFLGDYINAVQSCRGLISLTCTQLSVVPPTLRALQSHPSIRTLRIPAKLDLDQAELLVKIRDVRSLTLDASTWNVIDILPKWTGLMSGTLTALSFYSLGDLNTAVLSAVLPELPNLTGLHVVNCVKINLDLVIMLTGHTPNLESLACTCWERPNLTSSELTPLPHLHHFAIDNHFSVSQDGVPGLWPLIISVTQAWGCSLTSMAVRQFLQANIPDDFITGLLNVHESTLQHVVLLNCGLSMSSVRSIASRCSNFERLGVNIPHKDIYSFAEALSRSSRLDTLHDIGEASHKHGGRPVLTKDNVRILMEMLPKLKKVIAWDRIWTRSDRLDERFDLTFEKRRNPTPSHWFLPPHQL